MKINAFYHILTDLYLSNKYSVRMKVMRVCLLVGKYVYIDRDSTCLYGTVIPIYIYTRNMASKWKLTKDWVLWRYLGDYTQQISRGPLRLSRLMKYNCQI